MKKVTAKDIAKSCGISQATVSYVINNKEGKKISDATRKKVLQAAKELQYIPNSSARTMRTNKAMSIGIVTGKNCMHVDFNKMLAGVKAYVDTIGYSITVLKDEERQEAAMLEYLQYYRSNKIDGILFMFYEMTQEVEDVLQEYQIPYLSVDENGIESNIAEPKKAFELIVEEAVLYCKEKKWSKIGFLKGKASRLAYKYEIFEKKIEELFDQASFELISFPATDMKEEEKKLYLDQYIKDCALEIIVTPNQFLGLLTQQAIMQRSFKYPQDIKHICLGDSRVFNWIYPTVTAAKIPLFEIGEDSAKTLIQNIKGEVSKPKEFLYYLEYGMSTE